MPEGFYFIHMWSKRKNGEFLNGLKGRVGQDVVRSIPGRSRNNVYLHRAATKKKTIAVRGKNTDMFCRWVCKMIISTILLCLCYLVLIVAASTCTSPHPR